MKTRVACWTAVAVALLWSGQVWVGQAAAADEVPVRRSGQWELKTISAATGTMVSRVCITPEDHIIVSPSRGTCTAPKVLRAGDQTIVDTVCKTAEGEERISTLLTGDFTDWYRSIVKMTFDPPPDGGPPRLGVTIEGRYLGPECP